MGRLGDPTGFDVDSLYLWGEGLREMEHFFKALVPLERAAKMAPADIRVRIALGWCYKRIGPLDLAIHSLDRPWPLNRRSRCYVTISPAT